MPDHGAVPVENVIGIARMIVLPFDRFGWVVSDNPQSTPVGMAGPPAGVPLALGLVGALPLAVLRRRRQAAELWFPEFLPRRRP
jgi:signal peptidase I